VRFELAIVQNTYRRVTATESAKTRYARRPGVSDTSGQRAPVEPSSVISATIANLLWSHRPKL
jgi:hypothetical protein